MVEIGTGKSSPSAHALKDELMALTVLLCSVAARMRTEADAREDIMCLRSAQELDGVVARLAEIEETL